MNIYDATEQAYKNGYRDGVNSVKLVRCKDCKCYKPYDKPVEDFDGRCIIRECETDENEFCSYGERRGTNDL